MVEKKKYEYLKALHEIFISGISALNVVTNNADTIRLSTFTWKKIWVVVLPFSQTANDSIFLQQVDLKSRVYESGLQTLAIPSYEDGFRDDSAHAVLSWYQNILDSSIIISQPLYTHKASGSEQNSLFGGSAILTKTCVFHDESQAGVHVFMDAEELYSSNAAQQTISHKYVNMVLL